MEFAWEESQPTRHVKDLAPLVCQITGKECVELTRRVMANGGRKVAMERCDMLLKGEDAQSLELDGLPNCGLLIEKAVEGGDVR